MPAQNFDLRDKRRKYYYTADNDLVDLKKPILAKIGSMGLVVYSIIASKSNNLAFVPSKRKIAKYLGSTVTTISAAFDRLKKLNMIRIVKTRNGKKDIIELIDISNWKSDLLRGSL